MKTVRSASQIRDLLQLACASCRDCDDCFLGIVRTDPDDDGCNWAIVSTPLADDRHACLACERRLAVETQRLRATVVLPPADLPVREIETLQNILVVRELGIRPSRGAAGSGRAVSMGYAYVAADGRLDVSNAGREMLRRL